MKYCNHSYWFSLDIRDSETALTCSDRPQSLLSNLPNADSQKPSLIVLLGSDAKALAFHELIPGKSDPRQSAKRGYGETHLHLDSSSAFSDRPVLFADGNFTIHTKPSKVFASDKCHDVKTRHLPRLRNGILTNLYEATDQVYARLLSPFTDVFCIFASDLGGLESVAGRVASWLAKGQPSSLPLSTRPHIIIVVESPSQEQEFQLLETFLCFLKQKNKDDFSTRFAAIRVVSLLPAGAVSGQARHRRLRECLMNASDQVRSARLASSNLFSALNFAAFLGYACDHLSRTLTDPFNFIKASRLYNPPASDLTQHLTNLLSKIKLPDKLKSFAVPLVASSILLDSYPPDMHLFDPIEVFRTLYKSSCHQACRAGLFNDQDSKYLALPSGVIKLIESRLLGMFEDLLKDPRTTAVELHRQLLIRLSADSPSVRSDVTCLVCVRRRLQYTLPCGHGPCEKCVRAFCRISQQNPWLFEVDSCIFCGLSTSGLVVKTLPPTAGVRVITFDGGGVRGLLTLQNMQLIQERVGLLYPVQENFDVVFGTSSGAIIALGLFVNGWSVAQCMECFERLAMSAFQPRFTWKTPIVSRLLDLVTWIFEDGRYPAENIELALQEAFGTTRTILDCSRATATGAKIGLPVTTIWDASACIFTNYNAVGTRPRDCGYHVLSPEEGKGRVPLWEIARCSSAAPSYFRAKDVAGLGTFQDGGLKYNDPLFLALEEVRAIYPLADEPGLVVSLGTGSSRAPDGGPRMSATRGILKDSWIPRLFRAFKSSIGASCKSHYRRRGRKEQYFRFDVEFDGPEPRLDDISKMQELKAVARSTIEGSVQLDRLARCIIAELFLFELESVPVKKNGQYVCIGRIICRLRAGDPSLGVAIEQLNKSSAKFLLQDRPLSRSVKEPSCLASDGNFCQTIEFEVQSRMSNISIHLQEGSLEPCYISGSPFSINGLLVAQQLEAPFGSADHVKRRRADSTNYSRKRQRL